MGKPTARTEGICMAFPDMLDTPTPPSGTARLPYVNIAQLSDAQNASPNVNAGGKPVITMNSSIATSTGGEAGTASQPNVNGACRFAEASSSVKANGHGIVRQFDSTEQNVHKTNRAKHNADGKVMMGFPTVLVGD